jgi:hypothetical protein
VLYTPSVSRIFLPGELTLRFAADIGLFATTFLIQLSVHTLGINGESSFEAELLEKAPGCEVWGYDFSVTGVGSHFNTLNPEQRSSTRSF